MSVKDFDKQLIVSSCLTGKVITVIPYDLYTTGTINSIIEDIMEQYVYEDEEGFQIKFGNML